MQNFGVLGNPIVHSLSPIIHNFLFSHFGILGDYQKYLIPSSQDLLPTLKSLCGANITLPYKQEVFALCSEVRGIAKEIGAVNTVIWEEDRLIGYNTDALGFWECIKNQDFKNTLILGSGGSAKAVALILAKNNIPTTIYNRNSNRFDFFIQNDLKTSTQIPNQSFDLIINATSAGLDRISLPLQKDILKSLFLHSRLVFDLIYPSTSKVAKFQDFKSFLAHRTPTAFCAYATHYGKQALDGLDMLVYQALFAFEIFAKKPDCFEELKALFYN